MTTPTRYRTTRRNGYQPAGMRVDVITLTATTHGGRTGDEATSGRGGNGLSLGIGSSASQVCPQSGQCMRSTSARTIARVSPGLVPDNFTPAGNSLRLR